MPLEFVQSQMRGQLLQPNGFLFTKYMTRESTSYWKCVYFKQNCPARYTVIDGQLKSTSRSHDHPADPADLEKRKRILALKESSRNTPASPAQIVADASIVNAKICCWNFSYLCN